MLARANLSIAALIYLSAADANGMMVGFIQSNYMGCGSDCAVLEFGISISLQNRGHDSSLDAGIGKVVPGKRSLPTILRAFLT
jgi:gamma-glutamyltranspeptidase/glutathione hydrolase